MKKLAVVVVAVAALLSASTAQAALLGHQSSTFGVLPRVDINGDPSLLWTPNAVGGGGVLTMTTDDDDITLVGGGTPFQLTSGTYTTEFTLSIRVDSTGKIVAGDDSFMTEIVTSGTVTIGSGGAAIDYVANANDVLLSGNVVAFGYLDNTGGAGSQSLYDVTVDLNDGEHDHLLHDGFWTQDVALIWGNSQTDKAFVDEWWNKGKFELLQVKTEKSVPAPGAALLAGIGLVMSRRIRRRKIA